MKLTPAQTILVSLAREAKKANVIWPLYQACEAWLESRAKDGQSLSKLAREANNLFGEKQHKVPVFDDYVIGTYERVDLDHDGVIEEDEKVFVPGTRWVKFPSWAECFQSRMATLRRLAPTFPHYKNAIYALSGEQFVTEVSKTWATDPNRAAKVLAIYNSNIKMLLEALREATDEGTKTAQAEASRCS